MDSRTKVLAAGAAGLAAGLVVERLRRKPKDVTGRHDARVIVVLGAQWGDEGKGKLVDILAQVRPVQSRIAKKRRVHQTRRAVSFPETRASTPRRSAEKREPRARRAGRALDPTLARARDAVTGVPRRAPTGGQRRGRPPPSSKSANPKPRGDFPKDPD